MANTDWKERRTAAQVRDVERSRADVRFRIGEGCAISAIQNQLSLFAKGHQTILAAIMLMLLSPEDIRRVGDWTPDEYRVLLRAQRMLTQPPTAPPPDAVVLSSGFTG